MLISTAKHERILKEALAEQAKAYERRIAELRKQKTYEVSEALMKNGDNMQKCEDFIAELKRKAFGKGTYVEILDRIRKDLIEFK